MLHITFRRVKEANACVDSYEKFAKFKGGVRKWGEDNPFPLSEVLEICGLQDAIWCFRCTVEPSENIAIEFACQCAEHGLHFYEDKYPNDKRPRQAIEATRACIMDKSAAVWATGAARDAVWTATWATGAARDVAGAAAWDAETKWQVRQLKKLLEGK